MSEPQHPRTPEPDATAGVPGAEAAGVPAAQPTPPVGAVPAGDVPVGEAPSPRPPVPGAPRPPVRRRGPGPLTIMGPWAPVAGALLGLVAAIVAVLLLRGSAQQFGQRLSLVLLVVGLSMLGAAGPLLADEVRMLRRGAREAAVRPGWTDAGRGLLIGLTPARFLLLVSAFVLFLAAYVGRG